MARAQWYKTSIISLVKLIEVGNTQKIAQRIHELTKSRDKMALASAVKQPVSYYDANNLPVLKRLQQQLKQMDVMRVIDDYFIQNMQLIDIRLNAATTKMGKEEDHYMQGNKEAKAVICSIYKEEIETYYFSRAVSRYARAHWQDLTYQYFDKTLSFDDLFMYDAIFLLKASLQIQHDWDFSDQFLVFIKRGSSYDAKLILYPTQKPHSPHPMMLYSKMPEGMMVQVRLSVWKDTGIKSLFQIAENNPGEVLGILGLSDAYIDKVSRVARIMRELSLRPDHTKMITSELFNSVRFKEILDDEFINLQSTERMAKVADVPRLVEMCDDPHLFYKKTKITQHQAIQYLFSYAAMCFFREIVTEKLASTDESAQLAAFMNDIFFADDVNRLAGFFSELSVRCHVINQLVHYQDGHYYLTISACDQRADLPTQGQWHQLCEENKKRSKLVVSATSRLARIEKEIGSILQQYHVIKRSFVAGGAVSVDSAQVDAMVLVELLSVGIARLLSEKRDKEGFLALLAHFDYLQASLRRVYVVFVRETAQLPNINHYLAGRLSEQETMLRTIFDV